MVRIAVLLGSARPHANSAKAMAIVIQELTASGNVDLDIIDPRLLDLPVPGPESHSDRVQNVSRALQERLKGVDGVVMMTPEYDGTISAVMKLLIEYLGYPSVLAGKPAILVGVAGGRMGAHRALEHLRSIATHIGCHVLPGSVSVAAAYSTFAKDGGCLDDGTEKALKAAAISLRDWLHKG